MDPAVFFAASTAAAGDSAPRPFTGRRIELWLLSALGHEPTFGGLLSNVRIGVLSGQQFGTLIPHVVEVYYEVAIPFCIQLVAAAEPHRRTAFLPFCKVTLKSPKPRDYPTDPKTLGEHLKKRRRELRLYQKDVALRLGVNEWTYHNWETDKTEPTIRMLPRIIEFLGYYPYPTPQTIREKLIAHRRAFGLSRAQLAETIGIDEGTVLRMERGQRCPGGQCGTQVKAFLAIIPAPA